MAYVHAEWRGDAAKKFLRDSRPGAWLLRTQEKIERTEHIKILCSSDSDPGEEWVRYELYDGEGKPVDSFTTSK